MRMHASTLHRKNVCCEDGGMRQRGKQSAGPIVIVLGALALAGCSAGESTFADLRGDAEDGPALPAALPSHALDEFDEETVRWVGSSGGTDLWLGEGADPNTICLLAYPEGGDWVAACGGAMGLVEMGGVAGRFVIVPDSASAPSNATAISENVYSRP